MLFVLLLGLLSGCVTSEVFPTIAPDIPTDVPELITVVPELPTEVPDLPTAEVVATNDIQPLPTMVQLSPLPPKDRPPMNPPILPVTPSEILDGLVKLARQDLAKRLSIAESEITLVDAREVVWPDSSLGCPQPGMMYLTVLTPGYLIILNAEDREYEYHAGTDAQLILCQNPTGPVSGGEVDR